MRDGPLIQLCYFITHDEYVWHTLVLFFFSVCYNVLSGVHIFDMYIQVEVQLLNLCWVWLYDRQIDSTTLVSQSASQLRSAMLSGLTFLSFWRNVSKSTLVPLFKNDKKRLLTSRSSTGLWADMLEQIIDRYWGTSLNILARLVHSHTQTVDLYFTAAAAGSRLMRHLCCRLNHWAVDTTCTL